MVREGLLTEKGDSGVLFSFLPTVSILPDLVGRIPMSPFTPGSIYRGFDEDVLPQVQIPNGNPTATSMSRDRKPVFF